ncbi:MAG: leucine-rich repeat protein [Clostridia bacterium]|nr:leucine-rich repeat protein [Clostridia bacterium]
MTEILRALFSAVLTVSLGSSVVILLMLLFRRPLRHLRAGGRYLLWLVIILRLAIPLTMPIAEIGLTLDLHTASQNESEAEDVQHDISSETVLPSSAAVETQNPLPSVEMPFEAEQNPLPQMTETASGTVSLAPATSTSAPLSPNEPILPDLSETPTVENPTAQEPAIEWQLPDFSTILAWVWFAAAIAVFVIRLVNAGMLNLHLSRLGMDADDETLARVQRLAEKFGVRRSPAVRVCDDSVGPLVYGLVRPTVLLPEGIEDRTAFVGVMAHELVHIRRGDLWLKLISLASLSIHWFNPLVYCAAARFAEEMELSCDELVLRDCDADARRGYGYLLLSILRRGQKQPSGLTTRFNPAKRAVKARFESILDLSPKRAGKVWIALLLAVCITMGTLVACRIGGTDPATDGPSETDLPETDAPVTTAPKEIPTLKFSPIAPAESRLFPVEELSAVPGTMVGNLSTGFVEVRNESGVVDFWIQTSELYDHNMQDNGAALFLTDANGRVALIALINRTGQGGSTYETCEVVENVVGENLIPLSVRHFKFEKEKMSLVTYSDGEEKHALLVGGTLNHDAGYALYTYGRFDLAADETLFPFDLDGDGICELICMKGDRVTALYRMTKDGLSCAELSEPLYLIRTEYGLRLWDGGSLCVNYRAGALSRVVSPTETGAIPLPITYAEPEITPHSQIRMDYETALGNEALAVATGTTFGLYRIYNGLTYLGRWMIDPLTLGQGFVGSMLNFVVDSIPDGNSCAASVHEFAGRRFVRVEWIDGGGEAWVEYYPEDTISGPDRLLRAKHVIHADFEGDGNRELIADNTLYFSVNGTIFTSDLTGYGFSHSALTCTFDTKEGSVTATYYHGALVPGRKPIVLPDETTGLVQPDPDVSETTQPVVSNAPKLTGDVYFWGPCNPEGTDYLLLQLTADRRYYAIFPEDGRLKEETGLTMVYEDGFSLYQSYYSSVGSRHYTWDEMKSSFSGYQFGDLQYGDELFLIERDRYEEFYLESLVRMSAELKDTSLSAKVTLTTPFHETGEDPDILRVRIVNKSDQAITVSAAYRLERRMSDLTWAAVACNGTPTFSPARYTIAAGGEAILDLDLSVYTALTDSTARYRIMLPIRGANGEEIELPCSFYGRGIGAVSHTESPRDWFLHVHDEGYGNIPLDSFTYSIGVTEDFYTAIDQAQREQPKPWRYLTFTEDSVTLWIPLTNNSREELERKLAYSTLTMLIDGGVITLTDYGYTVRYSESLAKVTYRLPGVLARGDYMLTLVFVDHPAAEVLSYRPMTDPEAAIFTAATVGGDPRIYVFEEGLTFTYTSRGQDNLGTQYTLKLPAGLTDGRIISAGSGAGSGELMIYVAARNGEGKTVYLSYYQYCGDPLHFNQVYEMNETQARELLGDRIVPQEPTEAEYLINGFDIHTIGHYPEIEAAIRVSAGRETGFLTREDFLRVTSLDLRGANVRNIFPLRALVNLTELDLGENGITDLSPLAELNHLTVLRLDNNDISDLSPLAGLRKLTTLYLNYNHIADISPLKTLVNLTEITLAENSIANLSPLAELKKLTEISLDGNEITDVSPLAGLKNLKALYLSCNQIEDVSPLSDLTGLTSLQLMDNKLTDISPLAGLANLTGANLSSNSISDITPLAGWRKIERLSLSANPITDISVLRDLTTLLQVMVVHCPVEDFSPLDHVDYVEPYTRGGTRPE